MRLVRACVCVLPGYGEGGAIGDILGLNSNFCEEVELLSVSMPSTNLCSRKMSETRNVNQPRVLITVRVCVRARASAAEEVIKLCAHI